MNKSALTSKTIWFNLIVAIAAFFPAVQTFIVSNPEIFGVAITVINMILRLITKKEVTIK